MFWILLIAVIVVISAYFLYAIVSAYHNGYTLKELWNLTEEDEKKKG